VDLRRTGDAIILLPDLDATDGGLLLVIAIHLDVVPVLVPDRDPGLPFEGGVTADPVQVARVRFIFGKNNLIYALRF